MSTRPRQIRLRYLDHENEIREIEAKGLLATCLQHEIDHLDGVLFVDHISIAEARHDPAQARQGKAQPGSRELRQLQHQALAVHRLDRLHAGGEDGFGRQIRQIGLDQHR